MNAHVATLWANALRSGKYRQGYSDLRSPDGTYCALGVLADIYINNHPNTFAWKLTGRLTTSPRYYALANQGQVIRYVDLPEQIATWANLSAGDRGNIIELNDVLKMPFTKIADHINSLPQTK